MPQVEKPSGRDGFVEEVGLVFDHLGHPRMLGRILGWLMVCDPPQQSSAQLARALAASKGTISTMTRQLVKMGLLRRRSLPGDRKLYFQLQPRAMTEMFRQELAALSALSAVTERGQRILEGRPPQMSARLREVHDFCAFMERELPALLERWEKERGSERR